MRFNDLSGRYTAESLEQDQVDISDNNNEGSQEQSQEVIDESSAQADQLVSESHVELLSASEASEKAVNIAASLDELESATVAIAEANGGVLPATSAAMLDASMESIMKTLGLGYKPAVTMEALKGTYSKKVATEQTLESMMTSIKNAGQAIISTIKKALQAAFNFLGNIFKSRRFLRVKLIHQKVELQEMIKKGAIIKTPVVEGYFVGRLSYKDTFSPVNVIYDSSLLATMYEKVNETVRSLRDGNIIDYDYEEAERYLNRFFGFNTILIKTSDGGSITGYGALVGQTSLIVRIPKEGHQGSLFSLAPNCSVSSNKVQSTNTPTPSELLDVIEESIRCIDKLISVEKSANTIRDSITGFIRNLEAEYTRLRSAMGSEHHIRKDNINKEAKLVQSLLTNSISRFPNMIYMAAKYGSEMAQACMRQYEIKS